MFGWLSDASSWLELVLNVIEAIALIISIVTFFYLMFNKFSVALRRILAPLGLGFFRRIKILFVCRQSQNKKRFFIEYALMETEGIPLIGKQWKELIAAFKGFYADGEEQSIYVIPNCTVLTTQSFANAVKRYFDYFNLEKVKRAFGIKDNLSFLMRIKIEEAYIMPTCLLNGLLSSFDENWEEFIRQYVSTAYSEDREHTHKILSDELFYTFNWLLWGPSYELEYRNGLWGGLCQISYGDESISIPAIADTGKMMSGDTNTEEITVAMRLREKFIEKEKMEKDGCYGVLTSSIIRIYDEIPFYKTFEKEINPHNEYFYEKIKHDELPFGIKIEDFSCITNYKTYKYYATAYVWALFIEEEKEDDLFKPEKCVAFYEHTNVADKYTYDFLIETLINKSLFHFKRMSESSKYSERKYRFILAMNDRITDLVKLRYQEAMKKNDAFGKYLKDHISLETKFAPTTIFRGFDDFFKPAKELEFVEVDIDDKKTLSLLGEFYTDIYIDVFPNVDERETFDNLLEYLRLGEENKGKDYYYHILLAKDNNNRVMGGCIFDYYLDNNSATIEFLAVKEEKQSGGYGTLIYQQVLKVLNEDAIKNHHMCVDHILIELNNPAHTREGDPLKYLYFWDKFNFQHLEFDYVQPPLDDEKQEVRELWLAYLSPKYQMEHLDSPHCTQVAKSLILSILADYFKYAMRIAHPKESLQYQEMDQSVKEEFIKTSPITKK